jgi:hypothetical protein
MATILLSAAGAAIGSGFGGTALGLSGAALGRAVGAAAGRSIDQRLMSGGSASVETGQIDRFRITGVGYGAPVQEVWGRMRVAGQIIWASRFQEQRSQSSSGKGASRQTTTSFSYTVSIAIALCRGEVLRVGRIWADGVEIAISSIDLRFYPGSEDQLPDPKIEVVEGAGNAPSYRGISYVVIEDLSLSRFGNRVPQFSFEVVRRAAADLGKPATDLAETIRGVALIPGTGEYALATTPVHFVHGPGVNVSANVHTVQNETDFRQSMRQLDEELPKCQSVSLVVSWFGNDLRCANCEIKPKVEQKAFEAVQMPWTVSGATRLSADLVPQIDGRPIYGGTPTDQSVIEAIQSIKASGKEVMFYPFILMDQLQGNSLPNPWSPLSSQPQLPWRGRITLSKAAGLDGSSDMTLDAKHEVELFLGGASLTDFVRHSATVSYSGEPEWRYRRFILHYANLCAVAGGVDAFCIGSEMRGMTSVRSQGNSFPMVDALRELAGEVREILGPTVKISYASDWSEYFGLHVDGDVFFNLDSLWADRNIDFVGIDNYMPISDWRNSQHHLDDEWNSGYDLDYLTYNIGRGEGFDWHYRNEDDRRLQLRTSISDSSAGEKWVYRTKDIFGWWSNQHYQTINGVRQSEPTDWVPEAKPIRFTEFGCPAVNNGTNEPNKFIDDRSSESATPHGSNGLRDDYIQLQYFAAMSRYWSDERNNAVSRVYGEGMVDFSRSCAWAWDARPFPDFPSVNDIWADGRNYDKGHWINGRSSGQPLSQIIEDICLASGSPVKFDVGGVHGAVKGMISLDLNSARSKLQPLEVVFDLRVTESLGVLKFSNEGCEKATDVNFSDLLAPENGISSIDRCLGWPENVVSNLRLTFTEAENDFDARTVSADAGFGNLGDCALVELPIQLTSHDAYMLAERQLAFSSLSLDRSIMTLPRKYFGLGIGDKIKVHGNEHRIVRAEESESMLIEAVRVPEYAEQARTGRFDQMFRSKSIAQTPVHFLFLDIPWIDGAEDSRRPFVAVAATPWPGSVSIWSSASDTDFRSIAEVRSPSVLGVTESSLRYSPSSLWDRGQSLRVRAPSASFSSLSEIGVLNGSNIAAIGDGSIGNWELIQFSGVKIVSPDVYEFRNFLRGQSGTDAFVPAEWPAGSSFVLLDGSMEQLSIPPSLRGLSMNFRVGPTDIGVGGSSIATTATTFQGVATRPYSVSHLKAFRESDLSYRIRWTRRTRIDGDNWESLEVPIGETFEMYVVLVISDGQVVRRSEADQPGWNYSRLMQIEDGILNHFVVQVAQISESFGSGPFSALFLQL